MRCPTSPILSCALAALVALAWSEGLSARTVLNDNAVNEGIDDREPVGDAPRYWRPLAPEPHPYTAEPGTVQIEIDPLSYATDRDDGVRSHSFDVPVRIKLGVAHDVDVQLGVETFAWEQLEDRDTRTSERDRGFGDVTLASKINLMGNDDDEGGRAIAVMPEIRLPTRRHEMTSRAVEGGVLVPIAFEPVTGWEVEATPQFFADRDSDDAGYHFRFTHLIVVNREIVEPVTGFVELEQIHRSEGGRGTETALGGGLTFDISERQVVEWGLTFGLSQAADDFATFITLVQRF